MMTIRTRIFIVSSIIILFILSVVIALTVISKKNNPATTGGTTENTQSNTISQENFNQNAANLYGNNSVSVPSGVKVLPSTSEQIEHNAVRQLAKIFIERYGSYSTDSNFQNIKDVQNLVTADLWKKISGKIGTKSTNQGFLGVTTLAVSTELTQMEGDKAQVSIQASQTENKDGIKNTVNKNVLVYLIKSNGNWLVDKFEWK